jgi:hypothetical protein
MNKKLLWLIILLVLAGCGGGGSNSGGTLSGGGSTDAASQQKIIFAGDSAAGRGNWSSYFGFPIENRGVDGLETRGLVNSIEGIVASKPNKIFITIGGNNVMNRHEGIVMDEIATIIDKIRTASPATAIFIHSILPCKSDFSNSLAEWLNVQIQSLCDRKGVRYISVYNLFKNSKTIINLNYYQGDGIHLNDAGYQAWANSIRPLVLS